jgi:hypothetical protein
MMFSPKNRVKGFEYPFGSTWSGEGMKVDDRSAPGMPLGPELTGVAASAANATGGLLKLVNAREPVLMPGMAGGLAAAKSGIEALPAGPPPTLTPVNRLREPAPVYACGEKPRP